MDEIPVRGALEDSGDDAASSSLRSGVTPEGRSGKPQGQGRTLTAVRPQTAHDAPGEFARLKDRLEEQAANGTLNALAVLRESAGEFNRADKYTRYKAAIVAAWLALSIVGIGVACPRSSASRNNLGAILIADHERAEFLIRNESHASWQDAHVRVNQRYVTRPALTPPGDSIVVTLKQLESTEGAAPLNLSVTDIELLTDADSAYLMRNGRVTD